MKRIFLTALTTCSISTSASADIWSETILSDVDLYLNNQRVETGASITDFNYARVSCGPNIGSDGYICGLIAKDAGTLSAIGGSLDGSPEIFTLTLSEPASVNRALAVISFMSAVAPLGGENDGPNGGATLAVIEAVANRENASFDLGGKSYSVQVFASDEAVITAKNSN